jgi:hypothetical protein
MERSGHRPRRRTLVPRSVQRDRCRPSRPTGPQNDAEHRQSLYRRPTLDCVSRICVEPSAVGFSCCDQWGGRTARAWWNTSRGSQRSLTAWRRRAVDRVRLRSLPAGRGRLVGGHRPVPRTATVAGHVPGDHRRVPVEQPADLLVLQAFGQTAGYLFTIAQGQHVAHGGHPVPPNRQDQMLRLSELALSSVGRASALGGHELVGRGSGVGWQDDARRSAVPLVSTATVSRTRGS